MLKKSYCIALIIIILQSTAFSQAKKEEDIYTRATKYFFQKKFEMAEVLFQEVIKKDPENALAYSYLGDIFLKKQQYDGALNLYLKAIDIRPDIAENYFRLGQIYYFKKNADLAIENFNKTLMKDDKLKVTFYHIGLTYLMLMRDKDKTIEYWENYIRLVPEDPQYDSIKRVIELLKDPKFQLPPADSKISIEEALLLGGSTLDTQERSTENKEAGHEKKKSKDTIEDIYMDDDL
jgi:tetratricopeptide (TPR) repeat protein